MTDRLLVIGNKNYSSWSLRVWFALVKTGLSFREERIALLSHHYKDRILEHSPAGKVPVLKDGDLVVWDTMAIIEYLAESFPALWPEDRAARAWARSISAEMHAGFQALRSELPMNLRATGRKVELSKHCQADIARIAEIWRDTRARFGAGGPWLFGAAPNAADAFFVPVAGRFRTYGVAPDAVCQAYVQTVFSDPDMQRWLADSIAEVEVMEAVERGRG